MNVSVESIFTSQDELCDETANNKNTSSNQVKLLLITVGGLMIYGFSMGIGHSFLQAFSSAIKLPLLFGASFLITLPAFHFIGLHLGSRLTPRQTILLCTNGSSITAVLAASFAPISMFFLLSGSSYGFMILFHVSILAFCSIAGTATIHRNLKRLREKTGQTLPAGAEFCFPGWLLLYAIVGTQSAWMLRPFVGSNETEFVLWNSEGGNFYESIAKVILSFLS